MLTGLAEQLAVLARLGYDEVEQTGRPLEVPPLVVQLYQCQGDTRMVRSAARGDPTMALV